MRRSAAKGESMDLEALLADINVPNLEVPDFGDTPSIHKDIFEERKRAAWKQADTAEARCDFAPYKLKITNHGGVLYITLWKKSVYGRTLSDIKADDNMVPLFADSITKVVRSVLGQFLSPEHWAVVTTPKRRHKVRNFGTMIAESIARQMGLPFYEDCAIAHSRQRVGAVFSPNNIPTQCHIIVIDDFVTTGQTLVAMHNLLVPLGKNCVFFAGINNNH